ncbi:traB domain-containing protein [Morus notabilis]|uniref:traB domain-containing protein n=1 Tax=Morus notabilis TaxID=981085 RepID=UPI000CED6EBE|nr:traB domain-containing protein [Morus notabilis]
MIRLTRLFTRFNSPESPAILTTLLPLRRPQTAVTFPPRRQFSTVRNHLVTTTSAVAGGLRRSASLRPVMDSQSPEIDAAAGEDFVRIENATAEDLSESIVRVDEPRESNDALLTSGGAEEESDSERSTVLPEELTRSLVVLSCESLAGRGICDVYLVGTAHVSMESCREVEAVISYLKPEVVFLELCSSRVAVLTPQNLKVPTIGEMVEMWKRKQNAFGILYSWFLAKVANKLEVFPGSEFRVAYEEAMKYGGRVILGDRPVQVTLRRTWGKMPLWHKIKLLYSMFFQAVFLPSPEELNKMLKEMDDVDMLTLVIQEMSKEFPTLMETLVHERDQYMSSSLLRIASEHNSVVAVVGKGHLQGIKKHWKQPVAVKDLLEVPSKKAAVSGATILKSLGVAVAGVAIISGIYIASKK